MTDRAIIAVFPDSAQAFAAATDIRDLVDSKADFSVKAAVVLGKDEKGNVVLLDEKERGLWGTLGGSLVGALVGLFAGPAGLAAGAALGATVGLTGDVLNEADDNDFAQLVVSQLSPGEAAVVAEVKEGHEVELDAIVERHLGRIRRQDVA